MIRKFHRLLIAILLMVSVHFPMSLATAEVQGNDQEVLLVMDRLSQEVLTLTEKGELEQAQEKLGQLTELFPKVGTESRMSIEALELASNTLVQGKRAFSHVTPDKKEIIWHMTQIRILVDALTHPNQPIWKGYYTTYIDQVSRMLHQAQRAEQGDLNIALQQNFHLYSILKPAMAVHQSPSTIEMLDSLYRFLVQQSHVQQVEWVAVQGSLEQLREVTGNVFLGEDKHTFSWYISSNSPIAMISIISFILVTVLTYSAWRMYRAERFQV